MSNLEFTKREKIFLAALLLVMAITAFIPQHILKTNEIFYIIFIAIPLSAYLATDKERINKGKTK